MDHLYHCRYVMAGTDDAARRCLRTVGARRSSPSGASRWRSATKSSKPPIIAAIRLTPPSFTSTPAHSKPASNAQHPKRGERNSPHAVTAHEASEQKSCLILPPLSDPHYLVLSTRQRSFGLPEGLRHSFHEVTGVIINGFVLSSAERSTRTLSLHLFDSLSNPQADTILF